MFLYTFRNGKLSKSTADILAPGSLQTHMYEHTNMREWRGGEGKGGERGERGEERKVGMGREIEEERGEVTTLD